MIKDLLENLTTLLHDLQTKVDEAKEKQEVAQKEDNSTHFTFWSGVEVGYDNALLMLKVALLKSGKDESESDENA